LNLGSWEVGGGLWGAKTMKERAEQEIGGNWGEQSEGGVTKGFEFKSQSGGKMRQVILRFSTGQRRS